MSNNHKEFYELRELVLHTLDGDASKEDLERLQAILRSDRRARLYYRTFLAMYCDLNVVIGSKQDQEYARDVNSSLFELAEQESCAPEIIIEKPAAKSVDTPGKYKKKRQRFNKLYRAYSMVVSVAAVLMVIFIAYTNIFPAKLSKPTATVMDVANAVWANNDLGLIDGERVNTYSRVYSLESGLVKLLYDYGATVVIEGPAEFKVDSEKIICLDQGRLYACVNKGCRGFTVNTPSSILVDIGTEFGVDVNKQGDSQLHVFKGEVVLNTGPRSKGSYKSKHYYAGQAVEVDNLSNEVNAIAMKYDTFKRDTNEPIFFESYESLPLGALLDNKDWTTTEGHMIGPEVVRAFIAGNNGLRGAKRGSRVGGAGHSISKSINLATLSKPLYVSTIVKWQDQEEDQDRKNVILTLSEINENNVSIGYLEGNFDLAQGVRVQYLKNGKNTIDPKAGYAGSEMKPDIQYLCVMKFEPSSAGNCKVSIGYADITNKVFPDEGQMEYQHSFELKTSELVTRSSDRYYLKHIALSLYSESILADNLMVTDTWSHMRLFADK